MCCNVCVMVALTSVLVQYYGDECFYDAVTVSKSHRGWLVVFNGFEGEPPQETDPSDILCVPGKQLPNRQQQQMPMHPNAAAHAGPGMQGGRGRGAPQQTPPSSNKLPQRAQAQQDASTPRGRRCRFGTRCLAYGCTFDHPEGHHPCSAVSLRSLSSSASCTSLSSPCAREFAVSFGTSVS